MMLIIFLGLIATLTSVCNGCDVGTQDVNNFDWNQATGTWFVLWHSLNFLDCAVLNIASPVLYVSAVTVNAYVTSLHSHVPDLGFITNWNSQGYFDYYTQPTLWAGRYYVIATDYVSFIILKHCPYDLNTPLVSVWFRSASPDNTTVQEAEVKMQENNIDASQLVESNPNTC